ncbi:MAG: choice-of-anchor B family protein [bacterium]
MTARVHATIAAAAIALCASLLPAASHATNGFIFLGSLNEYANGPFGPWDYSDVWGYVDPSTGNEYAILGTGAGTSIINVTDPFNPYETGFIPGNTSGWRDMHTYQGRLYITTEGQDSTGAGGGLQIVSLANPEAPVFIRRKHMFTAHTLWIDESTGVAYCNGASGLAAAFKAYNLNANLDNPPLIVDNGTDYIHDIWVGNGVAYTADINAGGQMRVLDISALPGSTTITELGRINYPSGATHNTWPHPDGIHVLTTDEICSSGSVRVFDVSDPQDIIQVSQIPAVLGTDVHNLYMKGTTAYTAWYAAGIRAFDVSNPSNPVFLGAYDTQPGTNGCFGCWSVYPFLPSGVIACSDMSEGLVLVAHVGASGFISGTVTAAAAFAPIDSAIVNVPGFYNKKVATDANGMYTFELPVGATTVIVSADGYLSDTQVVTINANSTTTHNVVLGSPATGVGIGASAPVIALSSAYPNPARGASSLDFALPQDAAVRADVFDLSGRRVRALASGMFPAGQHTLAWDARDDAGRPAAAGTYLYRVETAGASRSVKMTLVR